MRKEIFICDACNKEYHRKEFDRHPSNIGWTEINSYWICPNHEIKVYTNNKECIKFTTEVSSSGFVAHNMYKIDQKGASNE